jgi:hypothetical protein
MATKHAPKSLRGKEIGIDRNFAGAMILWRQDTQRGRFVMSRATTTGKQNAESLANIAATLEHHATTLRAAASFLLATPPISEILVEQESNRITGLDRLGKWVPLAYQAAAAARIHSSQNGVRQIGQADTPRPKRGK